MSALELDAIPIDEGIAAAWARLGIVLRDHGLRLPVNDSWIAATALSLGVPVVTQDRDFANIPDLDVITI
jgi:predicted nucleic acid-binding protein